MEPNNYEEIVIDFKIPTLVLAGPGSGKTSLLAYEIKRLLDKKTDKNTITVLTFGTDAKQHMYDKLIDQNGHFKIKPKELPHIFTMHSLGFEIVREKPHAVNLLKINLEVQPDEDIKKLMYRNAALILGFAEEDGKKAIECKQYGDCKDNSEEKKCMICRKYREIMSKCNYIDFDDQILFACEILENNTEILDKYQSRAKYLLVDEYQDINAAQFRFIKLLSRKSRNGLFVVGDDAQNIYSFRGSDPKFILCFNEYFPDSKTTTLPHSRRCHEKIMDDSFKILEKYYVDWARRPKLKYHVNIGNLPYTWQFPSEYAEAEMVSKIARYFIPEKTVLILVPKKEFFPLISESLFYHNVPHECPVDLLPERIRTVKHFIDWVKSPNDNFITRLVIEDLINKGIAKVTGAKKDKRCTPETIQKRILVETEIANLWEFVDKKNNLFSIIKNYNHQNKTILNIREGLLSLLNSYKNFKGDNQGEFARQLSVVTGIWSDPSKFSDDISTVVDILHSKRPTGPGSVELKTMRKAKGLEADIVMIVGLEDDIVPNPRNDIVEEARLFFVSMTRAKEKLFLFHSYKRPCNITYGKKIIEKTRSRFLDTIGRKSEWKLKSKKED
ncbi:MAG: ATP-dependent helicase [Candidatus Cloacimonetes bacterium]|nr:ATP-dependent helicase [Candidatus Cloacimonadota bacterium]